jgi:molybdate-binding protein/DNA-binding transcriptional regulator YhcF (GntR family)
LPLDLIDFVRHVVRGSRPHEPRSEALARELRWQIARGELGPGDRLPTVRRLATALGVHARVVGAAYAELKAEGLVGGSTGAGTRVVSPTPRRLVVERDSRLAELADDLLSRGLAEGFAPEEVEAAVAVAAGRWRADRRAQEAGPQAQGRVLRLAGSHDLSVEVLAARLGVGRHPIRLVPDFGGSLACLLRLAAGEADLAAVHLLDASTGEYNLPYVRRVLGGRPARLLLVVEREQGLMVAPGNPLGLHEASDLARPGLRIANRQEGSGTRALLDALLARASIPPLAIDGYARELPTHVAVAQAVAGGQADVGLGIAAAARAFGLDFVPLAREPYELAYLDGPANARTFARLRRVLQSDGFRAGVARLGGYHTERSGEERAVV